MKVTFIKKTQQSPDIYSFDFALKDKPDFIAGQFIELTLPFTAQDLRGNKRWFSLSSSPSEKYLTITTRINGRKSRFKNFLLTLKNGSEVDISQPMGDFVLPKSKDREILFVAIGIGITPFRSILNDLLEKKESRNINLIFASKNPSDFIFSEMLSKAAPNYKKHLGELEINHLANYDRRLKEKVIFISGPEKTVEKSYKNLLDYGIKPEKITVDYFHNYD